jgi:hypothetical protein
MNHQQRREYADAIVVQRQQAQQLAKQQAMALRVANGQPARPPIKDSIERGLGIALLISCAQGVIDMVRGHGPAR